MSKKNSTAPMPTAMTRSATLVTFAHAGHTYSAAHWPAAGPGVVALHGFTGSGLDFESLAEALPTFDWWALDLPGHGNTAPLDSGGSWMLETCAATAALIASLAAENPQRPIHLLGYSLGGRVALQTLARTSATEHREKLVVVGATPGIGDARERARRQDWDRALAEHIRREGMVAFLESWQQQPLIATQTRIEAGPLARMQARRRTLDTQALALAAIGLGTGSMDSCWNELEALRQEVLVMVGALDEKYRAIGEAMVARLPNGRLAVVEEAGHCCHLEGLVQAVALLKAFWQTG